MKKELVIVLAVFVLALLAVNVYAANESQGNISIPTKEDLVKAQGEILGKDIQVPAGIIFGLKNSEAIDLSLLIVMIVIFGCFVLLMQSVLKLIPIFKEGWMTWAAAVVITLIISITGAFISMTNFFFGFGNSVKFIADNGLLNMVLVIIILGVFVFGFKKLLDKIKKTAEIESAENTGFQATAPNLRKR